MNLMPKNLVASVKARLQNGATRRGYNFNLLLLRYGAIAKDGLKLAESAPKAGGCCSPALAAEAAVSAQAGGYRGTAAQARTLGYSTKSWPPCRMWPTSASAAATRPRSPRSSRGKPCWISAPAPAKVSGSRRFARSGSSQSPHGRQRSWSNKRRGRSDNP